MTNFNYPLPTQTEDKFVARNHQCSNLSLWLDRYVGYEKKWKLDEENKSKFLKKVVDKFNFPSQLISAYHQRWQITTQSFSHAQHFQASPEWRMAVGLGQTSILETSLTLDRITGIPLIPGSALKGLAATYAMLEELEETERKNIETTKNPTDQQKDFLAIFGTENNTGKIVFFDAVPTKSPILELDIMNNHYPQYYEGEEAPTPSQSPNPVYFLTLGNQSEFAFAVARRDKNTKQELVKKAANWLKQGLETMGVGAKTAAGYGYLLETK